MRDFLCKVFTSIKFDAKVVAEYRIVDQCERTIDFTETLLSKRISNSVGLMCCRCVTGTFGGKSPQNSSTFPRPAPMPSLLSSRPT